MPSELGSLGIRYLRGSTGPGFESREAGASSCANTRRYHQAQALGLAPHPPPLPLSKKITLQLAM